VAKSNKHPRTGNVTPYGGRTEPQGPGCLVPQIQTSPISIRGESPLLKIPLDIKNGYMTVLY